MRKKSIILPKISKPSGEAFKPSGWFVYFSVLDEISDRLVRFKKYEGFKKCNSVEECEQNALRLKRLYTRRLKNGWSPFNDKDVIWEDSLTYDLIRKKQLPLRRSKKTIPYYLSKYLDAKKNNVAHGSFKKYQSELRIFKAWLMDKKLDEIDISFFTEKEALQFFEYLKNTRMLSGKSLNHYKVAMNNAWNFARKECKQIKNPWVMEKYKEATKPQRPLNQATIRVLKSYLEKHDPQLWLAAQFMYYCFIRPKEMRFMQIKHLELFEGKITLYADITKNSKSRIVDVDLNFLTDLFEKYELNKYPQEHYIFSKICKPDVSPVGKNYFWNHFNKARSALGLPKNYQFYGFKHTGAVVALKNGANIKDIQHQMDHSDLSITDNYLRNMVGYESEFFKKKMPRI